MRALRITSATNAQTLLSSFSANTSQTNQFSFTNAHALYGQTNTTLNNYAQFGFTNAGGQIAAFVGARYINHSTVEADARANLYFGVRGASGPREALTIVADNYNIGISDTAPKNRLQINGTLGRNAPVSTDATAYVMTNDVSTTWLICDETATTTITLPAASSWSGRELTIKNITAFAVNSNASNVLPIGSNTAGTAILSATAGSWALLVSNGTNWVIMQRG
jgi:hypothetical protein